jgi:hypothetical protein
MLYGYRSRFISEAAVGRYTNDGLRYGKRRSSMLQTIAIVMVVLWPLGIITSNTMGGFIHALLVIAVVVILVRAIRGRRD